MVVLSSLSFGVFADPLLSLLRINGEEAESRFCEHKRLNMSTLRMTWEAKVQLKEILLSASFPEGT